MARERMVIQGCGGVFDRDWTVYSVQDGKGGRFRLPLKNGLPMRSVGYFFATIPVVFVLLGVPIIGTLLRSFGGPVFAYIAVPGVVAFALTQFQPDGRPAVRFLLTAAAHYLTPADRSAGRQVRGERVVAVLDAPVAVAADPGDTRLPCGTVLGPATVAFRDEVVLARTRGKGCYVALPAGTSVPAKRLETDAATDVQLDAGERLEITP